MEQKQSLVPFLSCFLVLLGTSTGYSRSSVLLPGEVPSSSVTAGSHGVLSIKILNGQDGINVIRRRTAAGALVEVRDENGRAVAGAVVRFDSPLTEPTVTFLNGGHTFSTVTELDGRARATGLVPLGEGAFQVEVTVKYAGLATAVSAINQTNYQALPAPNAAAPAIRKPQSTSQLTSPAPLTHPRFSGNAMKALVIAIAAGAAAGVAIGLHHGNSQSSTGSVGVGTPVAGAPH